MEEGASSVDRSQPYCAMTSKFHFRLQIFWNFLRIWMKSWWPQTMPDRLHRCLVWCIGCGVYRSRMQRDQVSPKVKIIKTLGGAAQIGYHEIPQRMVVLHNVVEDRNLRLKTSLQWNTYLRFCSTPKIFLKIFNWYLKLLNLVSQFVINWNFN